MDKNKLDANLAMVVSKSIAGVNANALKYLIPVWIAPLTGVTMRMVFGTIVFWIVAYVVNHKKKEKTKTKDAVYLLLIGAFGFYAFQAAYLMALKYTTPVSASTLNSLLPVWTFCIGVWFFREKFTWLKVLGLTISVAGAVLCMCVKRPPEIASNPLLGDSLAILGSIAFALYLIFNQRMLKRVDNLTLLKWTFLGSMISSLIVDCFVWPQASMLHAPFHWKPLAAMAFVLIFPTVISYFLLPIGLKYLNATVVAAYNNLVIAVTLLVALLTGQDHFSWMQIGAIALLVIGLYFVNGKRGGVKHMNAV